MSSLLASNYIVAVAVTAVLCVVASLLPRRWPGRATTIAAWIVAIVLIGNEIVYIVQFIVSNDWSPQIGLPVYLCDAAAFVGGAALITRKQLLAEITNFWAFAGTLQGLLTPDIPTASYDYFWFEYYIDHSIVIVAAFFLILGLKFRPRAHSVIRMLIISVLFTAADAVVDIATNSNYMFLRFVPATGSLLNYFGPWPWYMVTATFVAIIFFIILDAPFWRARKRALVHNVHTPAS